MDRLALGEVSVPFSRGQSMAGELGDHGGGQAGGQGVGNRTEVRWIYGNTINQAVERTRYILSGMLES